MRFYKDKDGDLGVSSDDQGTMVTYNTSSMLEGLPQSQLGWDYAKTQFDNGIQRRKIEAVMQGYDIEDVDPDEVAKKTKELGLTELTEEQAKALWVECGGTA